MFPPHSIPDVSLSDLRLRFLQLKYINHQLSLLLPVIDLRPSHPLSLGARLSRLALLLFYDVKITFLHAVLNASTRRSLDQAPPEIKMDPLESLTGVCVCVHVRVHVCVCVCACACVRVCVWMSAIQLSHFPLSLSICTTGPQVCQQFPWRLSSARLPSRCWWYPPPSSVCLWPVEVTQPTPSMSNFLGKKSMELVREIN